MTSPPAGSRVDDAHSGQVPEAGFCVEGQHHALGLQRVRGDDQVMTPPGHSSPADVQVTHILAGAVRELRAPQAEAAVVGKWQAYCPAPREPARIASDLLDDHEGPEAVAQIVTDALRGNHDYPGVFTDSLAALASRFSLRRGDGLGVMRWLLDLVRDPGTPRWLDQARAHR